ncbi:MAG: N-acetyltransferase [Deltaproteobacteria bacterium]|nr:N-acetyltransferase [Deltaproteobacteria bacterium]
MVDIVPVTTRSLRSTFIKLPWKIYKDDPCWVPPLIWERKRSLNPKKNPFFKYNSAELFLAFKNGEPVGRISAQVIPRHNKIYKDKTGFFGFFESIDDMEVSNALFETSSNWLRKQGCDKILGPMSFTLKDEIGILVEGFGTPPYILNGHNPHYYAGLMEACDFKKAKDWYAWHYRVGDLSHEAIQIAEEARRCPGVEIRSLDMKRYDADVRLLVDLFNEIWEKHWGFIPFSEEEAIHFARELRFFADPEMVFFVFIHSEPAGFAMTLPNINELLRHFDGRLFPLHWVKLFRAVTQRRWNSARVFAMGIKRAFRGKSLANLSVLLYVETNLRGLKQGYKEAEPSLTLEDNESINRGIELMGGKKYKTYRLYEKPL